MSASVSRPPSPGRHDGADQRILSLKVDCQAADDDPVIRMTTVDGVPLMWMSSAVADVSPVTGQAGDEAGIVFRVGQADEDLPRRGVTRIVAEAAAATSGCRAIVGLHHTTFIADGDEPRRALTKLTETLRWLPTDLAEATAARLRAEAAAREASVVGGALALRYGPVGPGLLGHREFGLATVAPSFARAWSETWFTAAAAVAWCSGAPASDLSLDLYPGAPAPGPVTRSPIAQMPAWSTHRAGCVAVSMLLPRTVAAALAIECMLQATTAELDEAAHWSVPIDGETVHVTVAAPGRDGLLPVLERVAVDGPTPSELAAATEAVERARRDRAASLQEAAIAALDGQPIEDPAVDVSAIAAAAGAELLSTAASTALVLVPEGSRPLKGPLPPMPRWSTEELAGTPFRSAHRDRDEALAVGAEGVTRLIGPAQSFTVHFDDCEALVRWRNGPRTLYGGNGLTVHVDETDWEAGVKAIAMIDGCIPPERHVILDEDAVDIAIRSGSLRSPVSDRRSPRR